MKNILKIMTFSKKQSQKTTFLQWHNNWLYTEHDSLSDIWEPKCKRYMQAYALI